MPSALIFYQYFYPDEVVSSIHLTDLAEGLSRRGWTVTAMPSNRSCRDNTAVFERKSIHNGITIRRVWRPPIPQSSGLGRILNAGWMIAAWSLAALTRRADVVIIGTDPILSVLAALPWSVLRPRTKLAHWCFDLYPEAAVADGILKRGRALSFLTALVRAAYQRFDLIADIGDCMRERLSAYGSLATKATLPPWALAEPDSPLPVDTAAREAAFGDAKLILLYSGSFGRSHSFKEILTLARSMKNTGIRFGFSITGNCAADVRKAVGPEDENISFLPFASRENLESRLSTADIHIVSLRTTWTGTVVPSKFFGALASGRPVLFFGSPESSIARNIREHRVGWVWPEGSEHEPELTEDLRSLSNDPDRLSALKQHCYNVYRSYFSRESILDDFDLHLRNVLKEQMKSKTSDRAERTVAGV